MNRKTAFFYLIFACVCFCAGCSQKKAEVTPPQGRLIFNCDGTDLLGNFPFGGRLLSVADIRAYVDAYAGTIPVSALRQGANTVSFGTGGDSLIVKRVEIALKYGDVETNGYF